MTCSALDISCCWTESSRGQWSHTCAQGSAHSLPPGTWWISCLSPTLGSCQCWIHGTHTKGTLAKVVWPEKGSGGRSHKTDQTKQSQWESFSKTSNLMILSGISSPKVKKRPRRKTNAGGWEVGKKTQAGFIRGADLTGSLGRHLDWSKCQDLHIVTCIHLNGGREPGEPACPLTSSTQARGPGLHATLPTSWKQKQHRWHDSVWVTSLFTPWPWPEYRVTDSKV